MIGPLNHHVVVLIVAIVGILLLIQTVDSAAAVHPYYGLHQEGYSSPTGNGKSWDPVKQITGLVDFDGATPPSGTNHLLGLTSTAGWVKSSDTPSRVMYQSVVQLRSNGAVYADPQVWLPNQVLWGCFPPANSFQCPQMAASQSSFDYAYYSMAWTSSSHVTFYFESHNSGNVVIPMFLTYIKKPSDASTAFSSGVIPKTYNGADYLAKLLQVGVEADVLYSGARVHQWGVVYVLDVSGQPIRYLANDNVFSNSGNYEATFGEIGDGSNISFEASGAPIWIGGEDYPIAADYQKKPGSTRPAGDVLWQYGTQLPDITSLWGGRALTVAGKNMNAFAPSFFVDGMYVNVRNSVGTVLKSGFTPLNMALPSSGTYYVDYANYGNYYITYPDTSGTATITDYNMYNWGGTMRFTATDSRANNIFGFYYDHANPGGNARLQVFSRNIGTGQDFSGMFTALNIAGGGTLYTKGYTPFTIGVPATTALNCCEVIWTNYDSGTTSYDYSYADTNAPETFDLFAPWGGTQVINPSTNGWPYFDRGMYFVS